MRERTGAGVFVAVVDSGVNPDHPHVTCVAGGARIELAGDVSDDYVDRVGHGTAVFAAVQEKAPGAELHAVRVFRDELKTSVRALVAAVDWAAERRARLVNMSLGTVREEHRDVLAAAVERLGAGGGLVVAAAEADGRRWWPGSLPAAVGVVADASLPRECVEVRGGKGQTRFLIAASPYPRPIPGVPPERNLNGISFAVANATGMLARTLEVRGGPLPELGEPVDEREGSLDEREGPLDEREGPLAERKGPLAEREQPLDAEGAVRSLLAAAGSG